jgi:ADP-ribose pyrophosphatase
VTGDGVAAAGPALVARADAGPGPLPLRDKPESWPVTASAELARGSLIRVRNDTVQMPGGTTAGREVVEHPGAVAIVALDDASRLLMVRQYRHPTGHLAEETGYRAARWHQLADIYSSPGFSNERIVIFLATELEPLPAGQLNFVREHEEASMAVAWVPLAAAIAAVQAGDLHNGVTALGILSAYAALGHAEGMLPRASQPGG